MLHQNVEAANSTLEIWFKKENVNSVRVSIDDWLSSTDTVQGLKFEKEETI